MKQREMKYKSNFCEVILTWNHFTTTNIPFNVAGCRAMKVHQSVILIFSTLQSL